MQITKISYSPKVQGIPSVNTKKRTVENHYPTKEINLNLNPSFLGNAYSFAPIDEKNFVTKGGNLRYGYATIQRGVPYSGRLVNDSKNMQIVSSYQNGRKTSMRIAWNQRDDMDDISIQLKPMGEQDNLSGGKTIYWKSITDDIEYFEDYDSRGKLFHTSLVGQKSSRDKTVVMTVDRDFETDGITPYKEQTEVDRNFMHLFGYKTRITLPTQTGTREICYEVTSKDKTRTAAKRTSYYDNKNQIQETREENVTYFDAKNGLPYARATKRIAGRKDRGETIVRDYGFKTTDYTQGAGAIRKFIYEEHPETVKEIRGNTHIYYDKNTKKRYAAEEYQNGKTFPLCIVDYEKKCAAEIKDFAKNSLFVNIYANYEKLASAILFEKNGEQFRIRQIDIFDPETEKRRTTKRIFEDGSMQTTHYDKNGNIINEGNQLPEVTGSDEN